MFPGVGEPKKLPHGLLCAAARKKGKLLNAKKFEDPLKCGVADGIALALPDPHMLESIFGRPIRMDNDSGQILVFPRACPLQPGHIFPKSNPCNNYVLYRTAAREAV